ncbi:unnamed protein product, partial [Rotaria sp. Silwood2]
MFWDVSRLQISSRTTWEEQVIGYWTPERMRKAKPIEHLRNNASFSSTSEKPFSQTLVNIHEPLTIIEPTAPDNFTLQSRLISPNNQATKTVGKVFFRTLEGGDATCSGSVVTAPSKSLVVTAGHCVFDLSTHTRHSNWIFIPDYDDGAAPLKKWPAKYVTALQAYTTSSYLSPNRNYDVGFVVVSPVNSLRIAQVTGSQGIMFNAPRNQLTFSFGYPGNIANAEIMSVCISKAMPKRCNVPGFVGQSLRCGMTQGSSGGPWILNFVATIGIGFINSVNSFGCNAAPNMLHGPYFDSNIK